MILDFLLAFSYSSCYLALSSLLWLIAMIRTYDWIDFYRWCLSFVDLNVKFDLGDRKIFSLLWFSFCFPLLYFICLVEPKCLNSVKIDELDSRVSGQVLWLRNLNKSREVSVVKETTTTFILMLEITNNYGLAWPTSLTPPGVITLGKAFHH